MSARTLATLNHLFEGRLTSVLAPGSSALGHRLGGIEEGSLWPQLESTTRLVRHLLGHEPIPGQNLAWREAGLDALADAAEAVGRLRSASDEFVAPPVWLASWGSPAGLRRVARCADGWLASAYALDVGDLADRRRELHEAAERAGRDPASLQIGVATGFTYVADSEAQAEKILRDRLAPKLSKDPEALRGRVLVGTPEQVRAHVQAFAAEGVDVLLLVPVDATAEQLDRISEATEVSAGQRGEHGG
jgi:alkanesulfonate monooxygenase SsuD/methylene tetrahydromethanopterin reductase-like flavin-dependent oxidoreductase (luciferase family)